MTFWSYSCVVVVNHAGGVDVGPTSTLGGWMLGQHPRWGVDVEPTSTPCTPGVDVGPTSTPPRWGGGGGCWANIHPSTLGGWMLGQHPEIPLGINYLAGFRS